VTLSTCSGLRGLLQFENASYIIEPLDSSPGFEHIIYQIKNKNTESPLFANNYTDIGREKVTGKVSYNCYLKNCVIFQYNYLGSDKDVITQKIVQILGFVNSMFTPLNMTIVLSSLEFWTDNNKIKKHFSIIKKYQRAVTLETFSVIIAQLLGLSLGIAYDDSRDCQCSGYTCIMHTKAVHSNGVKAFSSCSIRDFKSFMKHRGGDCLSNRPYLNLSYKRVSVCGNRIVERGEQCDCGSAKECAKDKCCTNKCRFKPRAKCGTGLCCQYCKAKNKKCRPRADSQCDLDEYCNGSSAFCPNDLYVQNGHRCEHNTAYCYKGHCQSADIACQRIYGKGSKNAPLACYEEINSQTDRFGHCGNDPKKGFQTCSWMDVTCGKLVCTYPSRIPFTKEKAAIIYAQVREHVCISLDYMKPPTENDPLLVKEGTKCGPGKVCINRTCQFYAVLGYDCNPQVKCNGHGVSNNNITILVLLLLLILFRKFFLYKTPFCSVYGLAIKALSSQDILKNWLLLSFCLFLPVLVGSIIMIVKWNELNRFCSKEDDSQADE
uniref:ADAM metallopeptidase domain 32 n=1 Tax=Chelydra serpentina TaxID=8475 RepID=A0A8C3T5H8_CHESE